MQFIGSMEKLVPEMREFLQNDLRLVLHPDKIFIKTIYSGVDFLGVVNFSDYRILRTKTKKRILKKIEHKKADLEAGTITKKVFNQSLQSYLGVLKHCEGYKIARRIKQANYFF